VSEDEENRSDDSEQATVSSKSMDAAPAMSNAKSKAKAKKAARKAKGDARGAAAAEAVSLTCVACGFQAKSRNQLFKHLSSTGHAAPKR
jgi:hypothetical protein